MRAWDTRHRCTTLLGRLWHEIFGQPELVVKAQLRRIHACHFIKPRDSLEIFKYSQVVSGSANVLTQFRYESDISFESVLISSAVRTLPNELKNKWLAYLQQYDMSYKNIRVFSAWLRNVAQVQDYIRLQFAFSDNPNSNFTKDKTRNTRFAATINSGSPTKKKFPLEDGEHEVWQYGAFKHMKMSELHDAFQKMQFIFFLIELWPLDSSVKSQSNVWKK